MCCINNTIELQTDRLSNWLIDKSPLFHKWYNGLFYNLAFKFDYSTAFTLNETFLSFSLESKIITLMVSPMVRTSLGFSTLE